MMKYKPNIMNCFSHSKSRRGRDRTNNNWHVIRHGDLERIVQCPQKFFKTCTVRPISINIKANIIATSPPLPLRRHTQRLLSAVILLSSWTSIIALDPASCPRFDCEYRTRTSFICLTKQNRPDQQSEEPYNCFLSKQQPVHPTYL